MSVKRANFPRRRKQRRIEAAERQAKYDALTPAQKRERNPKKDIRG